MISQELLLKDDNKNKIVFNSTKSNGIPILNAGSNLSKVNFKSINTFLKGEFREFRHAIEDNIDADYHNVEKADGGALESQTVVIERQGGLANRFVLFLLFLWYIFSALTLYTNKYIVGTRKADSFIVGNFI